MSLQGAHRTSGETIHLVLLPSQQRTHQAICTLPVPFKNKVLASSKISTFFLIHNYNRKLWRSQRASDGMSLHLASLLGIRHQEILTICLSNEACASRQTPLVLRQSPAT